MNFQTSASVLKLYRLLLNFVVRKKVCNFGGTRLKVKFYLLENFLNTEQNKQIFEYFKAIFKTQIVHAIKMIHNWHVKDKKSGLNVLGFPIMKVKTRQKINDTSNLEHKL